MIVKIRTLMKLLIIIFLLIFVGLVLLNSTWFLKLFYPMPYKDVVDNLTDEYNVETNIIYSIMKAESKFKKSAESPKGAKGLMQVVPGTALWVAEELNLEGYNDQMLFDPQYNIKIGTWYYSYLLKQFNGNNVAAIASYNGGETNVKKWLKKGVWSGTVDDVQNIPFKETRNYVLKVLMNEKMYQKLYGNNSITQE